MRAIFSIPKNYIQLVKDLFESYFIPYELLKNFKEKEVDVHFL